MQVFRLQPAVTILKHRQECCLHLSWRKIARARQSQRFCPGILPWNRTFQGSDLASHCLEAKDGCFQWRVFITYMCWLQKFSKTCSLAVSSDPPNVAACQCRDLQTWQVWVWNLACFSIFSCLKSAQVAYYASLLPILAETKWTPKSHQNVSGDQLGRHGQLGQMTRAGKTATIWDFESPSRTQRVTNLVEHADMVEYTCINCTPSLLSNLGELAAAKGEHLTLPFGRMKIRCFVQERLKCTISWTVGLTYLGWQWTKDDVWSLKYECTVQTLVSCCWSGELCRLCSLHWGTLGMEAQQWRLYTPNFTVWMV